MSNQDDKTCSMCAMGIPRAAKKCPHCHQYLSFGTSVLLHPGFLACMVVAACLGLAMWLARLLDRGVAYPVGGEPIQVLRSEALFGEREKTGPTVAVVGDLTNRTAVTWRNIRIEARFLDASGRLIDAGLREDYGLLIPAHGSVAFKISMPREFPHSNYVSHTVRVLFASDEAGRF